MSTERDIGESDWDSQTMAFDFLSIQDLQQFSQMTPSMLAADELLSSDHTSLSAAQNVKSSLSMGAWEDILVELSAGDWIPGPLESNKPNEI